MRERRKGLTQRAQRKSTEDTEKQNWGEKRLPINAATKKEFSCR